MKSWLEGLRQTRPGSVDQGGIACSQPELLECDLAIKRGLRGQVDDGHAAACNLPDDLVAAYGAPARRGDRQAVVRAPASEKRDRPGRASAEGLTSAG